MPGSKRRHERQLIAAQKLIEQLATRFQSTVSVRLWDGSIHPLGPEADSRLILSISGPGVIGSLLRWPTADNLLRHYALSHIDFEGADLLTFLDALRGNSRQSRDKRLSKMSIIRSLLPFLTEPAHSTAVDNIYEGNVSGRDRQQAENRDYVSFHYDVSNEFYELFLGEEMVYTCAYFRDWNESLDEAQFNKLDMICRKLRLQPGESLLDIGFGWGGLLCHAAQNYGVRAHGITLSVEQLQYAEAKIQRLGLQDRVTVEVRDYADLEGQFDKVASICMYEHVGIDNLPAFMKKVHSLLPAHGLFLLQGITRPGKATLKEFRKLRPERRLLARHIFPGAELDHLGHMVQSMETSGFEVADVEGWRNHYIRTCRLWSESLYENREEAIRLVGPEKYRMWLLYLVGCSEAFRNGGARLYQVLAERTAKKQPSGLPATREDLYHSPARHQAQRRDAA